MLHKINELWLPVSLLVAMLDIVAVAVWLAKSIDRRLGCSSSRWQFSLTWLLVAMTIIALHMAIIAAVLFNKTY